MEITKKNTPNQYELGDDIVAIVLHATLGSYKGAVEWLMMSPEERKKRTGAKSYSSAHAVFGRLGEVTELAPPTVGTWHAGAISKPSGRAKAILPTHPWGTLKNPNKRTLGLEFASGYDIDRDGMLEAWEQLYTKKQIKACVWYILNVIEPKTGKKFGEHNILTHQDITNYKPNLETQRTMIIVELLKQREEMKNPSPVVVEPESNIIISIREGRMTKKYDCKLLK